MKNITYTALYKKFLISLIVVLFGFGFFVFLNNASAVGTSDFKVNGSTSIIGTAGVTNLTFTGFIDDPDFRPYGCDANLFNAPSHTYVGPYPAPGQAGVVVPVSGAGNLSFPNQNGVFNYPAGEYYFRLTCFASGNPNPMIWEVYGDFAEPVSTITVNSKNCSASGLSWVIQPEGKSGSGTGGSYLLHPGSGASYTITPSTTSGTYSVTNSDGGGDTVMLYANQNKSFTISCVPAGDCGTQTVTATCGPGYQNPNSTYTTTTTYGPAYPNCSVPTTTDNKSSVCIPDGPQPLPACSIDSFPDKTEVNGVVTPTWATSYSNNVVLSGGQFGSGIQVEADGSRSINISSNTQLTITAYEGATCVGTVSKTAWMYAETAQCTVPGKEYLQASDPNCKVDTPTTCSFVDPYTGGDGFPDFAETGDGYTPIYWYSNAGSLVMTGGPYTNYPVTAPNSIGYFNFPNITTNTQVTLIGNGGQCSNSSILYAAAPPPKPDPFTAAQGGCSSGQIILSWGQSPGVGSYVLERNGAKIWEGGNYGNAAYTDTGRTAGQIYSYKVYGTSPNGNTLPNTLSATAPAICPVVPTVSISANPTNVSYGGSSNISWTSANATSCTATNGSNGWAGSRNVSGTFSTGSLTNTTTYTITCTGTGGTSAPVSATVTVGGAPPSSPQGFTVTGSSCGNNWLNLSWYAPLTGPVTSYQVYRDNNASPIYDGTGANIQLGGGAMGFSDAGLVTGSQHSYTVVATNSNGSSAPAAGAGTVPNNCPSTFDYSISDPGGISIPKGQSGQNGATATLAAGNTQPITFTFSNFPSTIHPSASACFPSSGPTCSSTFTYTVDSNANTQAYYVRVSATPLGATTVARDFYITVTTPTAISVACTPSLSTAKIGQTVTWSASASGGIPPYTYRWSGTAIPTTPAPTANPYSLTYSTIGIKSARATVTDSTGATGTCPDAVTNITFNPTIIEF